MTNLNKIIVEADQDMAHHAPKKYKIILADPPWKQSKGGKKSVRKNSSGTKLDYPVISLSEIKEHLAFFTAQTEENSILFLWTIDKYLHEAEAMANELGFKLHARMVWNKVTGIPAAFTIRYGHEYLLYMYRGKLTPVIKSERGKIHSVFTEQVKRHSQKPEISYQIIERLYKDGNKIELYARKKRDGWDAWSDEIE
jgi:N6-adenosine-specific RNA methylase IME4